MNPLAAENRSELLRWLMSGIIVLVTHGAIATAAIVQWREEIEPADPAAAIVFELAPMPVAPPEQQTDIPPGPEQVMAEAVPEKPVEKEEEKLEEKIVQAPEPEVVMKPPEPQPEPPKPQLQMPAPATTAPQAAPVREAMIAAAPVQGKPNPVNSNAIPTWKSQIVGILERNKRYPSSAQSRHEQGVAQLAFSLDRQGKVVASSIVKSSGSSALDQETLELVKRAQPFPPPPAEIPGGSVTLTVPIRFNIR